MSTDIDLNFPLIYCNGDSYSDENFHEPLLVGNTYVNSVASYVNGFAINKAISGSCNRRIIRTTIHDLILQRKLNPAQQIIALVGLSFEIRSELWADELTTPVLPEESNFKTHQFTTQVSWRENLLAGIDIKPKNKDKLNKNFFKKFSDGRAFFYSPYAERINLLTDLIMFRSFCESLNINFLVFQSPKAEKLESDYLLDFLKGCLVDDKRFFDLETFGFCDWCAAQKFTPLDFPDRPQIGHYGPDAHAAFAEKILIPKLKELLII